MLREVAVKVNMIENSRPYDKLKFYQDICELRRSVTRITEKLRHSHIRLVSQMRDSARSAKQNIREGYRKGTLGEYMNSIRISQGSLEELAGDIKDCKDDNLITEAEYNELSGLCRSASYMSNQYMKSLYKIEREGTWKVPGSKLRKRNLKKP
ncbi:MAG: hypothetical protein A2Z72_07330 [Omnitrophica bacterium RBG_13_46_9]|nr:MAG: hypothetical protein A2Z72_07330 [Omnitrophica bacterium RBG_13_46_9]